MRDAPDIMYRGSAVTDGDTIYCISRISYTIYSYHTDQDGGRNMLTVHIVIPRGRKGRREGEREGGRQTGERKRVGGSEEGYE